MDYYADTLYVGSFRDEYGKLLPHHDVMPFSDVNSIDITDYDVAVFPVGNSNVGFIPWVVNYGRRYNLSSSFGGVKVIDKIMEMIDAGKGVVICAQNGLSGNAGSADPKVTNLLENILGMDYRGKYKCGYNSGGAMGYNSFRVLGTTSDPIGMGQPKYFNIGDKSSGTAHYPLAYYWEVDMFFSKDKQKYFVTEHFEHKDYDTACGIRTTYEKTGSRISYLSVGLEGFGGLFNIKRNMMRNAVYWCRGGNAETGKDLSYNSNEFKFGGVDEGESKELELVIENIGTEDVDITQIMIDDFFSNPAGSKAFKLGDNAKPQLLEPGNTINIQVTFKPDMGEMAYDSKIWIKAVTTNMGSEQNVYLFGYGGEEPIMGGFMSFSTDTLKFGNLDDGQKEDKDIVVRNIGTEEFEAWIYMMDQEFNDSLAYSIPTVVENPNAIKAGDSLVFTVRFFPLYEKTDYHGLVKVKQTKASNDKSVYYIVLNGTTGEWTSVKDQGISQSGDITVRAAPNPVSETSELRVRLAGQAARLLKANLLDLRGRQVLELTNELFVPGEYKLQLNASGIGSGVYYLVMEYGSSKAVLPINIVK
jgi:hypothetical protein